MNLCITGGGTGGHLAIAVALAKAAKARGDKTIFIGSTSGQDRKYFQDSPLFDAVFFLETSGVVNKKGFGKLASLWSMAKAFGKARSILLENRIDAVYSVGGFSAAPASFASIVTKIPLYIHEQNAVEGKLNSMLKPYAKSFLSAYDPDASIKGYPVQEEFFSNARVRESVKTIIFLGGSQGAKAINDLALGAASTLSAKGIKIIHQAGEKDLERVVGEYEKMGVKAEVYGFTKDMPALMQRADLAVSRSGASTLWELCANGLPALFIPFPHAAGDHQYHNAQFVVKYDLGWCQRESKEPQELQEKLLSLLDEDLSDKSTKLSRLSSKTTALEMIKAVEAHNEI